VDEAVLDYAKLSPKLGIGLCKTLAKPWHSNLQRRAAPDPPKFFNYDFFRVKLILA
jgi:hypothetical protein